MGSTPVFPGNQFQQGNEVIMDTSTFTLGNTILNRYPALSTHTHQGMENSNTEAFPCFNYYADATPQMEIADVPAPAEDVPAPAPTLEIVGKRPHTPRTRKSTKNFGKPASAHSDSYRHYLDLD